MNLLQNGLKIFVQVLIFLIGLYSFLFVLDKVLLYANINPIPMIETMDQLEEEGWVVPLWYQILYYSLVAVIAYLGVFRSSRCSNWSLIVCILGLMSWFIEFYWVGNAFHMLNNFQVKVYFAWNFIIFVVIMMVLFKQLLMKYRTTPLDCGTQSR